MLTMFNSRRLYVPGHRQSNADVCDRSFRNDVAARSRMMTLKKVKAHTQGKQSGTQQSWVPHFREKLKKMRSTGLLFMPGLRLIQFFVDIISYNQYMVAKKYTESIWKYSMQSQSIHSMSLNISKESRNCMVNLTKQQKKHMYNIRPNICYQNLKGLTTITDILGQGSGPNNLPHKARHKHDINHRQD